jgi:two-component system phosphate regulon sensor histidine kinase PhoR
LLLSYVVVVLVAVGAMVWSAVRTLRESQREWIQASLEAAARAVSETIAEFPDPLTAERVDRECKQIGRSAGYHLTVILPDGTVIGDSRSDPAQMENHGSRREFVEALRSATGVAARDSTTVQRMMLYVAVRVPQSGPPRAVVRTAMPLFGIEAALRGIGRHLALTGLFIALVAGGATVFVSRRLIRPLQALRESAERFAKGALDHRAPLSAVTEIGRVADSFNAMAAQLRERIERVTRQRDEQETLLSCMSEGVLAVNGDGTLLFMNQAAAVLFGVKPDAGVGRSLLEVVRNADVQEIVARTLRSEETIQAELYLPASDRHLQARGARLRRNGGPHGAVIVLTDVSEMRRLERMRRDFVANVSHELKTPVTAIKGYAETLRDGAVGDPADRSRFLEVICRQADRLQAIIEDLLALAAIEHAGDMHAVEMEDVALAPLLEAACRNCRAAADEKRIRIRCECPADLRARVNASLIEQAVTNLVENAVKYSDSGSEVSAAAMTEGSEIVLRVSDRGVGIAAEHLPRLFERFYRVDKGRSRKQGGTGLGLAIVKHVAIAHGGRVDVSSAPGRGSVFRLRLPVPAP